MSIFQSEPIPNFSSIQRDPVFSNTSDGIILFDQSLKVLYVNPAGERILNLNDGLVKKKSLSQLFIQKRCNKAFLKFISNILKSGSNSDSTIFTYDNGHSKKVISVCVHEFEENGTQQGFMLMMEDISATHNLHKHERDCAIIFAGLIGCICVYLFTWCLFEFTLKIHLHTEIYTLMIEAIAFLLFLLVMFFTSMTLLDVGIFARPSRLLSSLKQSLLIAAIFCGLLLLANLILRTTGHPVKDAFIGGSKQGAYKYIFTAIIQEFLSRGVMQTSIKSLMKIRFQKFFTILLTSLLFALMHLPFGFPFMMAAFLLSVILAFVYEKQQNIWGCAFLHWSIGYLAMAMFC